MVGLSGALLLAACADLSRPPLFPPGAADQPIVQEQALLGVGAQGDAAAAQLLLAEGEAPRLSLLGLDKGGGGPRLLSSAPPEVARAVAARVSEQGDRLEPLLAFAVAALWPQALAEAARRGFEPSVAIGGAAAAIGAEAAAPGRPKVSVRIAFADGSPSAQVLLLSEARAGGAAAQPPAGRAAVEEVELARMPLAGRAVAPQLSVAGGIAWMLAGSVDGTADGRGGPLRRTVGLRRASLARGEAELHHRRGAAAARAHAPKAARREFDRAVAADPTFADALYSAAAAAARASDLEAALALLRRAAKIDLGRVQVLGRDDAELGALREEPEVRALLGLSPALAAPSLR